MRKTDAKRHANKLVKTCSKAKLNITGMSCEHCVKAVTNAIIEAGGFDVTVSLEGGYAEFSVDSEKTVLQTVKAAIEDAGYDVE
jgi:copper chaperone